MCFAKPKMPVDQTPVASEQQSAKGLALGLDTIGGTSSALLGRLALRAPKTAKGATTPKAAAPRTETAPAVSDTGTPASVTGSLGLPFYQRRPEGS